MPGVVSHDRVRVGIALLQHPLGQGRGHGPHQHAVHPGRPRAQRPADAGGAEGEPGLEAALQLCGVAGQESPQLGLRLGIGIGDQPVLGPPAQIGSQGRGLAAAGTTVRHGGALTAQIGRQCGWLAGADPDPTACSNDSSAFMMWERISSRAQSAFPEATAS